MDKRTRIYSENISSPLGGADLTLASGINILSDVSGSNSLGAPGNTFSTVYTEGVVDAGGGNLGTNIAFVSGTTDTNTTNIAFVSGLADTNTTNISTNVTNIAFVSGNYLKNTGGTLSGTLSFASGVYIDLDVLADVPPHSEGRVFYDNVDKTLAYYNDETDVTVNVGQEVMQRAYNNTGSTILNGQPVYINGAQGDRPTIALATATGVGHSSHLFGVATADIADSQEGHVTSLGVVHSFDKSNVGLGTVSEGDDLYLSATPGELLTSRPSYFARNVLVATITKVAGNNLDVVVGNRHSNPLVLDGANAVLGINSAADEEEYKLISGVGSVEILHSEGLIQVSGIQGSQSYGEMYMINNATATVITGVDGYTIVSGTTSAGELSNFTHSDVDNSLTYTGGETTTFLVIATASVSDAASDLVSVALGKNENVIDKTRVTRKVAAGGDVGNMGTNGLIQLATNDKLFVMVTNETNTDSVTVEDFNLCIK